jgi:hypothetical protein
MTLDTEKRTVTAPAEACAKPPPLITEELLFPTIDELRTRHVEPREMVDLVTHAAVALVVGTLLFAALYCLILFME